MHDGFGLPDVRTFVVKRDRLSEPKSEEPLMPTGDYPNVLETLNRF